MTKTSPDDPFHELLKFENRPNPYPFWEALLEQPVTQTARGEYVVSRYHDVQRLLQDPRISSDPRNLLPKEERNPLNTFVVLDSPRHDRLRAAAMRHFGPPCKPTYLKGLSNQIESLVDKLIDDLQGKKSFDLVESISYPLPVIVISRVTGMPMNDHEYLTKLSADASTEIEFIEDKDGKLRKAREEASKELAGYFMKLFEEKRKNPEDDLFSHLVNDDSPDAMNEAELLENAILLLIGGHETTVNLISNAMLQLMRNPDMLRQVQEDERLVVGLVEEALRYEPPVQFRERNALCDVEYGGVKIPKGSMVVAAIASANRDPALFEDPSKFDVLRKPVPYLSFGGGLHFCFGAPLARMEAQFALGALIRRLKNPRLGDTDLTYHLSPITRGPERLHIEVDEVAA
ncbi:cytochrome P450 [Rhodobacter sphaeroides]|uniref:cytochrome P450 n=1 Tax=Cereibacter sphaeroides TaxID=1063 RepID=UPI001323B0FB|nr:cytochrome P450 [Cereibacter sphaeroides]MWP38475.1 cytochrome P450 [Cereibacter sphaeroides]